MQYIVYKHTSPSGNSYVGYTKYTLQERWQQKIKELRKASTPLAYALRKYAHGEWEHEVLYTTFSRLKAEMMEKKFIKLYGYYNVAEGGTGGNTGLNGNMDKIEKQRRTIKNHFANISEEEMDRRIKASIETRRRNGTIGNNNPRYKEEHGNWDGYWVFNNKYYRTAREVVEYENVNESAVIDLCVKKVDKVWPRSTKWVKKGQTPRTSGFYKTLNIEKLNKGWIDE